MARSFTKSWPGGWFKKSVPVAAEVTRLILFWEGAEQLEPPHVGSYYSAARWLAATALAPFSSHGRAAGEGTRAPFRSGADLADLSVFIRSTRGWI